MPTSDNDNQQGEGLMHIHEIPVRELTSRAAVFSIAAEIIQTDMQREPDQDYRIGCCAAFHHVEVAAHNACYAVNGSVSFAQRDEMVRIVREAKWAFIDLYKRDGTRFTKDSVFWMGTRSDRGQKRRITALLTAAKVLPQG
jgi:hypothetical protein